tara:strand:+ start:3468 stop:7112 length:3645 start_codon:yes stop_codon:yes gene_type:complete
MANLIANLRLKLVDGVTRPVTAGRKALGGLGQSVGGLQTKLAGLSRQRDDIQKFRELKRASLSTRQELGIAQNRVGELAKEMQLAARPSSSLSREFTEAKRRAAALGSTLDREERKLEGVRRSLGQAGIATRNLGAESRRLKGDIDKTTDALERKARAAERVERASEQMQKGLQLSANMALAGVGAQQAAQQGRAFIGGFTSEAKSFESAMAEVKKVVDFDSPKSFRLMASELRRLASDEIPLTAQGLAEIAAAGGQAGKTAAELPFFVRNTAIAATAFDMGTSQAGEYMGVLSRVLQLDDSQMVDYGDTLNHVANNSGAAASGMLNLMNRTAVAGKKFGLANDETIALGATFVDLGMQPEIAATAMTKMLPFLQTASTQTDRFKAGLEKAGLTASEVEDAIAMDGQAGLMMVLEALEALDSREQSSALMDLFGVESQDEIGRLVGGLDRYRQILALATDETGRAGSMQLEFENRKATSENKDILNTNKISRLKGVIGEQLLPTLNSAVDRIGGVVDAMSSWAEANPNLVRGIALVGVGITGLLTVMAPVILFLSAMIGSFAVLKYSMVKIKPVMLSTRRGLRGIGLAAWRAGRALVLGTLSGVRRLSAGLIVMAGRSLVAARGGLQALAFAAMNPVTSFRQAGIAIAGFAGRVIPMAIGALRALSVAMLTNPVGLIAAGIAAAGFLIWKFWKPLSAFFNGLFSGISEGLQPIAGAITEAFGPIGDVLAPVTGALRSVIGWIGRLLQPVEASEESLRGMTSAGRTAGRVLGFAFRSLLTPVTLAVRAIRLGWDVIRSVLSWSPVGMVARVWSGLGGVLGAPLRLVQSTVETIWRVLRTVLSWSPIGLLARAWSGLSQPVTRPLNAVQNAAMRVWNGLKTILSWSPVGLVTRAWSGLSGKVVNFSAIMDRLKGIAKAAMDRIAGFLQKPLKLISGFADRLRGLLGLGKAAAGAAVVSAGVATGGALADDAPQVRRDPAPIVQPVEPGTGPVRTEFLVQPPAERRPFAPEAPRPAVPPAPLVLRQDAPEAPRPAVPPAPLVLRQDAPEAPRPAVPPAPLVLRQDAPEAPRPAVPPEPLVLRQDAPEAPRLADPVMPVLWPALDPAEDDEDARTEDDEGDDSSPIIIVQDTDEKDPPPPPDDAPPPPSAPAAPQLELVADKSSERRAAPEPKTSSTVSVTYGDIHVHAAPGQSAEEVAEAVMRLLEAKERRALHDGA